MMAIHKRVPPLRAEPSSEYIVKLSYDLLTTYVSVTTVVPVSYTHLTLPTNREV